MIGISVGQYECQRLLGEGGTGAVYLAVHRVLRTPRAVKVLRAEWTRYPEIVERFVNEARAAAAIRHRNIIGIHDCGRLRSGEWYMLLDYFEGGTLAGFSASHGGPVALHQVVHILAEVANGVQAAHDHGIIHRDLKPDNVYLSSRDGDPHYVTILDFGVAKLAESLGAPSTGPGALVGTPAYMAPEQLRGAEVGPAADVFAIGAIAYQLLSGGALPFQREDSAQAYYRLTPVELYQRITRDGPVPLAQRGVEVPTAWQRALAAALAAEPARRPASPRALALLLAEATAGDGFAPSGLSLVRSYARELLEVGERGETVRTRQDGGDVAAAAAPGGRCAIAWPGDRGVAAAPPSRYRALRRIGAGGMAEVFEGAITGAEGFARQIAIKRVRSELCEDAGFAEMFIVEARLASELSHPNVVSVLDFDRDRDGRLFLVMEYVDGLDLASLMSRGRVPVSTAIFVASEVLRGLSYAHELPLRDGSQGLEQGDVSPHYVLLSHTGAVKVSDFGIAKALRGGGAARSSRMCGKPAYMSPEQVHAQPLDARSDLFAVGVILWEMLTGQQLFTATTTHETLAKVLFKDIAPPRKLRREVSPELDAVVMALLARPRELRVASARHAVERLLVCREAPRDGRGELVELLTRRPAPEPRRDVARVGRGALLGVGAGLVCAAGALSAALGDGARRGGSVAATQRPASAVTAASAAGPTPDVRGPDERGAAIAPRGGAGAALAASADAAAGRSLAASAPSHTAARAGKASSTALRQAPALGRLVVAISPWAAVWIDGRPYGETPLQLQLPVGRHRVRLVNHRAARTLTISITATRATLLEQDL